MKVFFYVICFVIGVFAVVLLGYAGIGGAIPTVAVMAASMCLLAPWMYRKYIESGEKEKERREKSAREKQEK